MTEDTTLICAKLRSGKKGRDEVINLLYKDEKLRKSITTLVMRGGGSIEDAQSVFNLALIQFVKTVVKRQDLKIDSSISSYIVGVAKFVWYKEVRQKVKHRTQPLEGGIDAIDPIAPESLVLSDEKNNLLKSLLNQLGKNCKEVLMHWANGYKMEQIAKMMNYQSAGMAKKKKYQCMKQLLAFVAKHPQVKEALR